MNNFLLQSPYQKPFELSAELSVRYKGEDYISRMPFLMNTFVDDSQTPPALKSAIIPHDSVFMGIAGLRALDLLCMIGADKGVHYQQAVLFDKNQAQIKAMSGVLQLLKHCESPGQFREALLKDIPPILDHVPQRSYSNTLREKMGKNPEHSLNRQLIEDAQYFNVGGRTLIPETKEEIQTYLKSNVANRNLIFQPDNYQYLHEMAVHDRIKLAVLDLNDRSRFGTLSQDFDKQGFKAGYIYLSSAIGPANDQYKASIFPNAADRLGACVGSLALINKDDTRFIWNTAYQDRAKLYVGDIDDLQRMSIRDLVREDVDKDLSIAHGVKTYRVEYGPNETTEEIFGCTDLKNRNYPRDSFLFSVYLSSNHHSLDETEIGVIKKAFQSIPGVKESHMNVDSLDDITFVDLAVPKNIMDGTPDLVNMLIAELEKQIKSLPIQNRSNHYSR